VNAISPPDGTTDFPITGTITITFSKEMDPSSIDESTIPIISDSGDSVAGSFTTIGTVTVFTPSQNLKEHTRYKVSVSRAVMDSYGIAMDHSESFYFTTHSFPPPKVVDIQPASRAKNVSLKTFISIQFSEPMDPSTINTSAGANNIKVSNAAGDFSGGVLYNDTLDSATFYPDIDFASNTNYFVTVMTGVNNSGETPLSNAFVASFKTGTTYNATAPTVVPPPVPNNNAQNVSVNTPISATFSEPMDLSTITPMNFIVSQGTATIPGDIKCYGLTAVFTPTNPLANSTTYTVTIRGYHSTSDIGVTDLAGNSMVADYAWHFTTGPQSPDTVGPSVLATWPTSSQNNVPVYNQVVALLSESMLASSITPTTFVLVAQNDPNKVPIPGQVKSNGAAVIFIPSSDLTYNTTYTAAIISTTTPTITLGATDRAGNPLGNSNSPAGYTWNFTTSAPASFTITSTAGPGGSITPPGSVDVNLYSSQTFTITPNAGYSIDDVLVDGVSQGPVPSFRFDWVASDHSISASFLMTITATAGANGSISPSGAVLVSYNATQAFTITPNTGYHINAVGGTCGGTLVGTTYTTSAVTKNCTVQPSFAANPVITASPATNGIITPSGSVSVAYGGSQSFTFTPNAGYYLTGVLVDGVAQTPVPPSYTFTNVIANHTISATFGSNPVITASAGTGGSITPSGSVSVTYGADQTFTFTPTAGYYVSAVTVDGANVGLPNSYTFHNVTANHSIAVAFAQGSYTITATAGVGGTLTSGGTIVSSGSSQDFLVSYGGSRPFTIAPIPGYSITSVVVDGLSQGAITSYTFTNVQANHTIVANFAINSYALTVNTAGNGSGTTTGTGTYTYGATATVTAAANTGSTFTGWSGACSGSASPTTVLVDSNKTCTATFTLNGYPLTVNTAGTGSGTTTGAGAYPYGATATVTAAANTGSTFTGWSGDCSGTVSPTTVVMNAAKTCTATFTINSYTVASSAGANGSITPLGNVPVNYNGTTTFTVTPNAGYTATVGGTCGGSPASGTSPFTYTTNAITGNCTVAASFSINTFTITATAGANGSINPSGAVVVNYNANQAFTISPNTGYHVADVLVDGASVGAVTSYTFTKVKDAHTIDASFLINSYTLTVNTAGTGSGTVGGAGSYNYDVTAQPTAVANSGSTFTGWSGACSGSANPTSVVMTGDLTCTATFMLNPTLTVNTTGTGSGTVGGAGPYNYGVTAQPTAVANSGSTFTGWSGACSGSASPTSVVMNGNKTCTATFTLNTYTLTVNTAGNGNGTVGGAGPYNYGVTAQPTAVANTGSTFTGWSGACSGSASPTSVLMNSDKTCTATFTLNTYTLTVNTAGTGGGTVTGAGTYTYGTNAPISATADGSSTFVGWSGDCSGSTSPTTILIDGNQTCTATFDLI
jgi:uncharacterized repeat protein (TIGR02543 family)